METVIIQIKTMIGYKEQIHEEMLRLAKISNVIFLGQQVGSEDFYGTLAGIDLEKRLETPVAEELQLGMSIGMALEGYLPISIYQRMDFLPRACDQLVNHLSLIERLSRGLFNPKVIIRTTVGSRRPLDTGLQHSKDLVEGFRRLVSFPVFTVRTPTEVRKAYKQATNISQSSMIVEYQNLYKK